MIKNFVSGLWLISKERDSIPWGYSQGEKHPEIKLQRKVWISTFGSLVH